MIDQYEHHLSSSPVSETHISPITRDLRYILTQKCNYQCSFCHKEWCDGSEKNLLHADDYAFIFATAKDALWIDQVTLSGGEPMMRKDIWTIAKKLHDSGAKTTMVSNWALIPKRPEILEFIDILNLSLHTTQQDVYTALTWSSTNIENLIQEIASLHTRYPHLRIKLNSAIIAWQNTPETDDFMYKNRLASRYWWKLKYLELSDADIPGFVDGKIFEQSLTHKWFVPYHTTARQHMYRKDDVEVITGKVFCSEAKQTDDPQWYCRQYNDIYITPDGYLSVCPMDIKKISAYRSIVSRDSAALKVLLETTIAPTTPYACSFSSSSLPWKN